MNYKNCNVHLTRAQRVFLCTVVTAIGAFAVQGLCSKKVEFTNYVHGCASSVHSPKAVSDVVHLVHSPYRGCTRAHNASPLTAKPRIPTPGARL